MWSFESDDEVLPQSPVERLHGESSALLSHGGTGGRRRARSGESPLARAPSGQCAPPPPAPSDRYAAPTFARRFVVIDCRHDPCGGSRPRLRRSPAAGVSALPCGPSHGQRSRRSASRYRPVPTKRSRPRADQACEEKQDRIVPTSPGRRSVGCLQSTRYFFRREKGGRSRLAVFADSGHGRREVNWHMAGKKEEAAKRAQRRG